MASNKKQAQVQPTKKPQAQAQPKSETIIDNTKPVAAAPAQSNGATEPAKAKKEKRPFGARMVSKAKKASKTIGKVVDLVSGAAAAVTDEKVKSALRTAIDALGEAQDSIKDATDSLEALGDFHPAKGKGAPRVAKPIEPGATVQIAKKYRDLYKDANVDLDHVKVEKVQGKLLRVTFSDGQPGTIEMSRVTLSEGAAA